MAHLAIATLRGMAYMEILIDRGPTANVTVWSNINSQMQPTTDLTDALELEYDTLTENGEFIVPNGERYFAMDWIDQPAASVTDTEEDVMFVPLKGSTLSIALYQHASLPPGSLESATEPYEISTVFRHTTYVYDSNTNFYMLISPGSGDDAFRIYVMQTFTKQVDDRISIDNLNVLGNILRPPEGWVYVRCRLWPDQTLSVTANGEASVLSDEFANVYQYLDPANIDLNNYPNDITEQLYKSTAALFKL